MKAFAARKAEDLDSFETAALLAVENIYPDATKSLHRQLSRSMTDRYARLLYWKSHEKKLRTDRHPYAQSQPISPPSGLLKTTPKASIPLDGQTGIGIQRKLPTVVSETEPSTATYQVPVDLNKLHLPRPLRGGASSIQINKAEYPCPPKLGENENLASCTFCHRKHDREQYEDTNWWR